MARRSQAVADHNPMAGTCCAECCGGYIDALLLPANECVIDEWLDGCEDVRCRIFAAKSASNSSARYCSVALTTVVAANAVVRYVPICIFF